MYISIEGASREYFFKGRGRTVALEKVNLEIKKGEFICLLGPSGCGKTTLLNLIAGFDRPTTGFVKINGEIAAKPSVNRITIFQNYGLLPWRTVLRNVELGLESKKIDKKKRLQIAEEYIELVGLSAYKKHHPAQLSGGMQQRVALARALAVDPEILLMDEPLGALDAMTRMSMQDEIERLWQEKKKTIIFVTHDIEEAVFLADRIVIMTPSPGKVKSVVEVPLARKRDRTGSDFLKIRDRVFAEFELKPRDMTEYYL
ncbi:ABC transporter ATP-binding protein [Acetivibrio mesophilus]|uniref:ABC-type quaternary amine transporter n=1 Tax=Acetivibrio mesophilus TaxID=2487273 RepID=A0A4Q0I398_9FIRM|nr:ABC transporter ATP-binding protein [Acetivibrio mesophilus]ODM27710.1 ABC transporter [Clostridium sp. Bc-iso-3]RXE58651.1 ABC transporter ATP-binding protein [Acetivibrio mesophilus]HHV30133.1 ABC transporter ATP-binding protein [Clostridium sp.]